jgi:predicted outer membrane protein
MKSLNQIIAVLEVEAGMIESHVKKLAKLSTGIRDEEHRRELQQLAEEEETRAQKIRHHVLLLRDHLDERHP